MMFRPAIPPGLTCCRCTGQFRRALARSTDYGWAHAAPCPSPASPDVLAGGTWVHSGGIARWQAGAS